MVLQVSIECRFLAHSVASIDGMSLPREFGCKYRLNVASLLFSQKFVFDSEHNIINERIPPVAYRRFKDGNPTSDHSVAFSNCLVCVERRENPSLTHCNLHVFPFLSYHGSSKSNQGLCMDVFTSADVGDVTDVKVLTKRLRLVVVRQ
ncbi:hypothetical protein AAC387_Pa10g0588 [Persea americana]